ncbi:DUF1353 domain-containing protein [Pseudoalteromonas luteoviolacea]|uniref:DUF1353 domain-containing protein n=1 Tax=Pseudoalteromonas luteoviolacea S4054 TaxID=1129367 RepID=A0A0F6A8Q6_9GAMM|nr:DUF1353 domain-containing protein [Pseudoalteromonas luteoviolacea]AOT11123.1 hypothetical protein S4054249_25150 [Pseudoalteromonas luteoviolacea]AOT15713.1 hypothetical protein S40542_23360 [Pseudoalteromonas luteoviolacea]AOT20944.1 hypothetical protein S4054_25070 [Pseudoalteromonas luteoviolacea]KKE82226.1 hypothetical protein N479_19200 [Pseudoalteromonas luteoviolacea S4054]KZN65441.1 hypothetical protein N481_25130 [Pseudoalteromonas luteoviolacea S4047-1]
MNVLNLKPVSISHSNKLNSAYELVEDFQYEYDCKVYWVPKFFQYDGASIPKMAYYLVGTPFNPRYMQAALVHDWLYHTHELDRVSADDLFYSMLLQAGVRMPTAVIMKRVVELFGSRYWHNDDADIAYKTELEKQILKDGRNPSVYGL